MLWVRIRLTDWLSDVRLFIWYLAMFLYFHSIFSINYDYDVLQRSTFCPNHLLLFVLFALFLCTRSSRWSHPTFLLLLLHICVVVIFAFSLLFFFFFLLRLPLHNISPAQFVAHNTWYAQYYPVGVSNTLHTYSKRTNMCTSRTTLTLFHIHYTIYTQRDCNCNHRP